MPKKIEEGIRNHIIKLGDEKRSVKEIQGIIKDTYDWEPTYGTVHSIINPRAGTSTSEGYKPGKRKYNKTKAKKEAPVKGKTSEQIVEEITSLIGQLKAAIVLEARGELLKALDEAESYIKRVI